MVAKKCHDGRHIRGQSPSSRPSSHHKYIMVLSRCILLLLVIVACSSFDYFTIKSIKKLNLGYSNNDYNNDESYLSILNRKAMYLVDTSYENFKEGVNLGSNNPKEQMGTWINRDLFYDLIETFNNSKLDLNNHKSNYFELFNETSSILWSSLNIKNDDKDYNDKFSISLFHLPLNSYCARRHDPGTIILYKSLYGSGRINSYVNNRLIQSELLETNYRLPKAKISTDILSRIGGPYRIFQSQTYLYSSEYTNCTIFLEIAIFPPSHLREEGNLKDSNNYFVVDYVPNHIENNVDIFAQSDNIKEKLYIKQIFPKIDNILIEKYQQKHNEIISNSDVFNKVNDYDSVYTKLNSNIGGLSDELKEIIRRILLTRKLDSNLLDTIGLRHVRGLLLHGPPGTGKTLIAREIANALNSRPPKIVNGPEILDKFVGEAERNIRELFQDAENEYKLFGMKSQLHVIIFDEIDSLAKKRGNLFGDGSGTRDSVCNQLLAKLDGISELNNILVIGLTNRIDLIDDALLRPGRLEVHIQIDAPNKQGRKEILYINFKPMVKQGLMSPDAAEKYIKIIARKTQGYTGAELTGLIRSAISFALDRSDNVIDNSFSLQLNWDDFNNAIIETKKRKSKYELIKKIRNFKKHLINYVQDIIPGETSETFTWN